MEAQLPEVETQVMIALWLLGATVQEHPPK